MAASVPLLDFGKDQNAVTEDVRLSARQRRKTRKRISEGVNVEESLVMTPLPMDVIANSGTPALPVATNSAESKVDEDSIQFKGRSARARRSHSKRQNGFDKSLPSPLPPVQSGPRPPLQSHKKVLPPIVNGKGSPQHSFSSTPLPPLHSSFEDSAVGVADLLRRKLELDGSQAEDSATTTEEDIADRRQRRKFRSSARKKQQALSKDEASIDQKNISDTTQLVDNSRFSHPKDISGEHSQNLDGFNQKHLGEPSVFTDGDVAEDEATALVRESNAQKKGRPLPQVNLPTSDAVTDITVVNGQTEPHESPDIAAAEPPAEPPAVPPALEELYKTCQDVLGITVHDTDELKASIYLSHPCVKISIMDVATGGNLLKKSAPDKCVTSYYETGNPSVDYILPVLTKPYDCREHKQVKGILKASWEELLVFNDFLVHFTHNPNVVIFFELVDFVRGHCAGTKNRNKPWHRIAWAFLRPTGKVCQSRFGNKIRLQLYKYKKKRFYRTTESPEVYTLWSTSHRTTYPSTLYITLQAIPMNSLPDYTQDESSGPVKRSMFPLQQEIGSLTLEELAAQKECLINLATAPSEKWASRSTRLPGQPCKIPMSVAASVTPTRNGCSALAFSNSGHILAAGCVDHNDVFPLILLKVPSFEPVFVLEGHRSIIYSLCWDPSDSLLVSSSADRIVKVWSMDAPSMEPWASLPHPCYVYCACFVPTATRDQIPLVATGAYDGSVRMWEVNEGFARVVVEFQVNSSYINCMCWSMRRQCLYVGDSHGIVSVWKKTTGTWKKKKTADLINSQALSSIFLHPNGRNVLLHSFKQTLSMIDLRIDSVACKFTGKTSSGLEKCGSLISPCGGLVFAGASNGMVHVWNSSTGEHEHTYEELPFTSAVSCMAYHPSEHLLVLSAFGASQPIMALNHDSGSDLALYTGPVVGTSTLLTRPLDSSSGNNVDDGTEIRNVDSESDLTQSLKVSQKWRDLTKTLDRISNKIK